MSRAVRHLEAISPGWSGGHPFVPCAEHLGPESHCGQLTVPEDRAKPEGKTIKVRVAIAGCRIGHSTKRFVALLNGGPRGTSITFAVRWVRGHER